MERNDTAYTSLRIDRDLYGRLRSAAENEGRSVNQQVVYFIRQGLQRGGNYSVPQESDRENGETGNQSIA